MVVDELANRHGIRVGRPEGQALVGRGQVAGEDVALAKPQTYMNLSGNSVRELLAKYELDVDALLVMWDEMQLPLGTIRIHPDHPLSSRKEHVLRPMKKAELEAAAEMVGEAGDAVEMILTQGLHAAMTK